LVGIPGYIVGGDAGVHCWWSRQGDIVGGNAGARCAPRRGGAHDEAEQGNILKFAQTASGTVVKLARRQGDIVKLVKFYAARWSSLVLGWKIKDCRSSDMSPGYYPRTVTRQNELRGEPGDPP
jgi:hypothetical protein